MEKKSTPRILFLSYGFPRPGTGIGMRLLTFLRSLHNCSDITFVARTPPDLGEDELQNFKRLCSEYVPIPVGSFEWSRPLYKLLDSDKRYLKVLPLILSTKPVFLHANILANNRSGMLDSYLKTVRWSDFDILHVNRLFMADSIMDSLEFIKKQRVYTVLDLDDIESKAVDRELMSSLQPRTAIGRTLRRLDLRRLRRYEKRTIPLFDACIVCSDSDRAEVLKNGLSSNPWVIPNAVDTRYFQPDIANASENQDILFVGNMNFPPNVDAVRYFAEKIFPAVLRRIPSARFIVAGQNPVDSVSGLANGDTIIVTGKVADTREYYNRCAIAVAPIRFGGGTRVKILEAMAMGKAVVTTPIGVEGIPATDHEEMIITSDENDFAAGCIRLLEDRLLRAEMGRKAREFVSKYFDTSLIEDRIRNCYLSAEKHAKGLAVASSFQARSFKRGGFMNLVRLKKNLSRPRVPWRIQAKMNALVNGFYYYKNKLGHSIKFAKDNPSIKSIVFENGFHGKTGSTYAIASIANLLSKKYRVEFVSFPRSNFNPLLKKSVRIVRTKRTDADLYICTVTCDLGLLEELRRDKKKIMITCHSLLNALHGLSTQRIQRALSLADKVHFVSAVQQDSFKLEDGRYCVIPNTNAPIRKRKSTRNVGMVGNLAEPRKNVKRGVDIALKAEAEFIHLWGAETLDFNNHPRIKVHGWSNDKNKIFDSFDVLISLSDTETFGLVVSEALSAGMPCLLSDIPAFRQFKDCRGVVLVDANDERVADKLNGLLRNKNELKSAIFKFWQEHYSEEVLAIKWHQAVDAMLAR